MREKQIKKLVNSALEDYEYLDLMYYFLTEDSFKEKANENYNDNISLCEYAVAKSYKYYLKNINKKGIIHPSLNVICEDFLSKKNKTLKYIRR